MESKKICTKGRRHGCPYTKECKKGKYGANVVGDKVESYIQLWCIAKRLTSEHNVWVYENKIYTCLPSGSRNEDNVFKEDVVQYKEEILKVILDDYQKEGGGLRKLLQVLVGEGK